MEPIAEKEEGRVGHVLLGASYASRYQLPGSPSANRYQVGRDEVLVDGCTRFVTRGPNDSPTFTQALF
jgi:hypothetical protein